MVFADVGSQLEESGELILVGTNVHCRTREHIRRAHKDGEAHPVHELVDVVHRRQGAPFGLIDTVLGQHLREFGTVLCSVDIPGLRSEDAYFLFVEEHREVVRYLSTRRHYHPVWLFHFDDVHNSLKGELVEVQSVAHVVVCRHRFGVVVDHHRAVALLADGVERLHSTPVELHAGANTIGSRAKDDD